MKKYSWILALLLALTLAFVGCGGGDDDDEPPPPPPSGDADPIDVTFGEGGMELDAGGTGATAVATEDGKGFVFTYGSAGHGNTKVAFKIDLGSARVLDYEKITFTFEGISGDLTSTSGENADGPKGLNFLAAATKSGITGYLDDDALVAAIVNPFTGAASGSNICAQGVKIGEDQPKSIDLEIAIDGTRARSKLSGEVWFSIYLHAFPTGSIGGAGSPTKFKITNINFVPLEGGGGEVEPEPEVVTFEVLNPKPITTVTANTVAEDGTVTVTANGVLHYAFDFIDEDGNGVEAYDFVEVTYSLALAEGFEASGGTGAVWKKYGTTDDFTGGGNLAIGADTEKKFELRYTGDGISIQEWNSKKFTLKISKLVFSKGERFTIRFNNGVFPGTTLAPTAPKYLVKGTKVGPLPDGPYWALHLFTGWFNGTARVSPETDVGDTFKGAVLTAKFADEPEVEDDFEVEFDADMFEDSVFSGTVALSGTNGYVFTYASGEQYGPYAMFKVTFPEDVLLAYYDKVTLNVTASNDNGSKTVRFIASPTAIATYQNEATLTSGSMNYGVSSSATLNGGSVSINISKGKAYADLQSNEIWIGFYVHNANCTLTITDIVFSQNPRD